MSTANITSLPAEITEKIAQLCDSEDLLALRQVNRDVSLKVFRTFVEFHFSERTFLLCHEPSLLKLDAITDDTRSEAAAHFAKALKKLVFCTNVLPKADHNIRRRKLEKQARCSLDSEDLRRLTNLDLLEQYVDPIEKKNYEGLLAWQQLVQNSNTDVHILTTVFSRLRQLSTAVEIKILDPYPHGDEMYPKFAGNSTGETLVQCEDSRPLRSIIEALSLSGLQVDKFSIATDSWLFKESGLSIAVGHTNRFLAGLKHFDLRLGLGGSQFVTRTSNSVSELSTIARSLETLSLGPEEGVLSHMYWTDLAETLSLEFPLLKVLRLRRCVLGPRGICDLMLRHKTLTTVHFQTSCFGRSGVLGMSAEDRLADREAFEKYNIKVVAEIKDSTGLELTHTTWTRPFGT